ncbi:hypothetical protein VVR12_01855 [Rothia sp. LK2588]|uniref:hypothetical protein n=1 Tax=Rothia sp. LK2588 TaxID=3114369 RepID=UPI0034CDB427
MASAIRKGNRGDAVTVSVCDLLDTTAIFADSTHEGGSHLVSLHRYNIFKVDLLPRNQVHIKRIELDRSSVVLEHRAHSP